MSIGIPDPDEVIANLNRLARSSAFAEHNLVIEIVTQGSDHAYRRVYRTLNAAEKAIRRAEERGAFVCARVWELRAVGALSALDGDLPVDREGVPSSGDES